MEKWKPDDLKGEICRPLVLFNCQWPSKVVPLPSRLRNEVSRISLCENLRIPFPSLRLPFFLRARRISRPGTNSTPRKTEGKCGPRKACTMELRFGNHEISIKVNNTYARTRFETEIFWIHSRWIYTSLPTRFSTIFLGIIRWYFQR